MEQPAEFIKENKITKYMTFKLMKKHPKTTHWWVVNNKSRYILGEIYWHSPWRQYIFDTYEAIYNDKCLAEIKGFLEALNQKQKDALKK